MELQEWEDYIKSKNTIILDIIIYLPFNNTPGNKESIIYFIRFAFGEGVTIIDCLANMKLFVSEIVESYKETIIWVFGKC